MASFSPARATPRGPPSSASGPPPAPSASSRLGERGPLSHEGFPHSRTSVQGDRQHSRKKTPLGVQESVLMNPLNPSLSFAPALAVGLEVAGLGQRDREAPLGVRHYTVVRQIYIQLCSTQSRLRLNTYICIAIQVTKFSSITAPEYLNTCYYSMLRRVTVCL